MENKMEEGRESQKFLEDSKRDNNVQIKPLNNHETKSSDLPLISVVKKKIRSTCTKKTLYKRLPVLGWMSGYTKSFFVSDMLAGLTVGLTAIPQGIAYAVVAGLEPQYGLYSGFMGCFVYFILGSSKDITIGPTAIMALMAQKSVESYNSDFAVLLCFLAGCIILLFGILHLGVLVSFISLPVTIGFTSAAAITIASSQLKGLLGITGKSNEFLESWISVVKHFKEIKYQDLILGLATIFFLVITKSFRWFDATLQAILCSATLFIILDYALQKKRKKKKGRQKIKFINDKMTQKYKNQANISGIEKFYKGSWRIISLAKNAIAVIMGALAAFLFEINGMTPFRLTGNVKGGIPTFNPPPFSTTVIENNVTRIVPFEEMISNLGTGIIFVPMISVLETIAIAKAFAKGKTLDATQEMIALGVSNIFGSFARSMPTAGSFTRTAVNNASGVKTPLGGLFTGVLVLSALALTSTFKYIPKATLAAVIVTAMFYMVEYHEIILIWNSKKTDIIPLTITIIGCLLLGLDYGILIGIFVNLIFILYAAARPKVIIEELQVSDHEILLVRPQQMLIYPGAEHIRDLVVKRARICTESIIVVDGQSIYSIDATVAKNMKTLADDLSKYDQKLIFWNWKSLSRKTCLRLDVKLEKYFRNTETIEELLENV